MAVPAATLEQLTERVHQLEDELRELQFALSSRGLLERGTTEPDHAEKADALIQLLDAWAEGDEREQQNTWGYLKDALDKDRASGRKLFP